MMLKHYWLEKAWLKNAPRTLNLIDDSYGHNNIITPYRIID